QAGADRIVTVKLVDKTTGKSVPDAVIFATRLDMAPDGMQEMVTKVTPMPGTEPGTYRFKATFSMAGRWQLSLGAKVQGENGSVESKLVVTAEKRPALAWPVLPPRSSRWQVPLSSPVRDCKRSLSPTPSFPARPRPTAAPSTSGIPTANRSIR